MMASQHHSSMHNPAHYHQQQHHSMHSHSSMSHGGSAQPSLELSASMTEQTYEPYGGTVEGASSGMLLGQYRRHSASMSAAPISGAAFATETKPARSRSWAPESPKKRSNSASSVHRSTSRSNLVAQVVHHFQDSVFSKKAVRSNRKELIGWLILIVVIVVGYKLWSDGGFSAILTLASALQCFALALLNLKVFGQRSIVGVSERSLILIAISLSSRLLSTLFWNGYLPVDRSGDWVYQMADICSVALTVTLLLYGRFSACKITLQQQADKDNCYVLVPSICAFILSLLIHPTLNQNLVADVSWTFALYLETLAMMPQIWLMTRLGGEVEALTSHYVASMAASKAFATLFWFFSYSELAPRGGGFNWAGWAVFLSYLTQSILFGDFFFYYIKSLRIGKSMIIEF